jgi:hypothetical protein
VKEGINEAEWTRVKRRARIIWKEFLIHRFAQMDTDFGETNGGIFYPQRGGMGDLGIFYGMRRAGWESPTNFTDGADESRDFMQRFDHG